MSIEKALANMAPDLVLDRRPRCVFEGGPALPYPRPFKKMEQCTEANVENVEKATFDDNAIPRIKPLPGR